MKYLIIYLVIINLIGFITMGIDKKRSQKHKWRISEMQIFITAIIGGAVGVQWGMKSFRHKTKHTKFTVGIPVLIILNIAVFGYIFFWLFNRIS